MVKKTQADELPGSSPADGNVGNEAAEREAHERELLLNERRERQMGGGKQGKLRRYATGSAILLLLGGVVVTSVGSSGVAGLFSSNKDGQRASSETMEVDREKQESVNLDFVVPSILKPPSNLGDPDKELNERFKKLQEQLAALERAAKKPALSASDIKDMLDQNARQLAEKYERDRKALEEENERLKAEAARLAEEARQRGDDAKLDELRAKSGGVVIDQSNSGGIARSADEIFMGPGGQQMSGNRQFLADSASSVVETSVSQPLMNPSRMIVQGTIISAVLETAINTELPGNIRAQVMEPVYSYDGSRVLMPSGTVLIGTFNEQIDIAQKRVLIAWNRAITPKGKSIAIGGTGTDVLGRSGTGGNVDNRYGQKFGAALLVSAISAAPTALGSIFNRGNANQGSGQGITVNVGGGGGGQDPAADIASGIGKEIAGQGKGILERYLSLSPVIRVPQGEEIRIFVNRDLVFK